MRAKNLSQWKAKMYYFAKIGNKLIFSPAMKYKLTLNLLL